MSTKKRSGKIKNKKGQELLIDFFAILVFALIIVGFMIIISVDKNRINNSMKAEFENKDAQFMLISFLNAPIIDNPDKTVSNIIAEDALINDFSRTKKLFEEYFRLTSLTNNDPIHQIILKVDGDGKSKSSWPMMMVTETENQFSEATYLAQDNSYTEMRYAEAYIPGYDGKILVKFKMFEEIHPEKTVDEMLAENKDGQSTPDKKIEPILPKNQYVLR